MALSAALSITTGTDAIDFEFSVTNDGSEPTELTFRSGFTADFAVFAEETERWRWSEGKMFTQALRSETLEPGESVSYEGTWSEPESGEYTAVATLQDENHEIEAREPFAV